MKKLEDEPAKSLFWPSSLKSMSLWPGPVKLKGTDTTSQYYCEIEGRIDYSHVCLLFCWGELLNKCCCFDFCLFSTVGKQLSPESGSVWLIRLDHQQFNQGLFVFGVRDAMLIQKWKNNVFVFFFGSWGQRCQQGDVEEPQPSSSRLSGRPPTRSFPETNNTLNRLITMAFD